MIGIKEKFKEIEKKLYTRHSQVKKNGLEHVKKILDKLQNPQQRMGRIIHITGTNGKGSVAYITEAILRACGYKTALYTSPHISGLQERIRINSIPIPEKEFIELYEKVISVDESLSFFEIMTLIAFLYFRDRVDYSVIEVGIGGLYDTTNVFEKKDLCFITSVGFDHMDMLGSTLSDIAFQKAGIIKENCICIIPELGYEAKKVIEEECRKKNAKLIEVKDFFEIVEFDKSQNLMIVKNLESMDLYPLKLVGVRQTLNLSMVLKGLEEIGIKPENKVLTSALSSIEINCRFEIIKKRVSDNDIYFILDGAHNPQAFDVFIENIKYFRIDEPSLIFSILSTKDYNAIIKRIVEIKIFKKIIITEIDNQKKLNPYFIADMFYSYSKDIDLTVVSDLDVAIKTAISYSRNICVAGSFYLVSEAKKIIKTL